MAKDGISVTFPDLDALIGRMSALDASVQRSIARRSTAKGIRLIRDRVRANAAKIDDPKTKNNISKNVHVQWAPRLAKAEQGAAFRVGIRGGGLGRLENEQNPGGDTYYWRFLEFGTTKLPAKPFFRPAIEGTKETAMQTAIDEALRLINVESKKLTGG